MVNSDKENSARLRLRIKDVASEGVQGYQLSGPPPSPQFFPGDVLAEDKGPSKKEKDCRFRRGERHLPHTATTLVARPGTARFAIYAPLKIQAARTSD
ncbi:hypothetical protein J6590_015157 [Homalodisca vitripennis]|nr:hypothetical protein J6590_015157 [Homalodisca vitripennis]